MSAPPRILFSRSKSLWIGLALPFAALKLILRKKRLLFWSLLPIALTFVLYVYGIAALQREAQEWVTGYISSWGWDPEGWAAWSFSLLTHLILLLVSALTFAFTSTIVASPFNDFLAEQTERFARPPLSAVSAKGVRNQLRVVGIDVVKSLAAAFAALFALLLSWVPVLNIVAFAFAFLLVSFQYISYPQTRRMIKLGTSAQFLWKHLFACVGFGGTITFLFAMPFVSTLALPLAVVGGTLLVARAPGSPTEFRLK